MAAVFLDRDDTLIRNTGLPDPPPPAARGDITDPALVEPLPGSLEACERLHGAGLPLVVVTNQGVVARGGINERQLDAIHAALHERFTVRGERLLSAIYACPFHPRGDVEPFNREHPWRKPQPGMLLQAAADLGLDLETSWMVGDAERDILAGLAAGLPPSQCLRVGTGADAAFASLRGAADHIVRTLEESGRRPPDARGRA